MAKKLAAIAERGVAARPPRPGPARTSFTDEELNAFLKHNADVLVPGMKDPEVKVHDASRVSGRALVDLDAVREAKPRGWLDPLAYVAGSLEVTLAGQLRTAEGFGRFELESASVGGVPVSSGVLQELVSFYTKTPEQPDGINLDGPFPLPARVRAIELRPGTATIIQ
jgi:hypothetical protein